LKDLIINGKAVKSIWKTPTPKTEESKTNESKNTPNIQNNPKHGVSRKGFPFIPESYSDPTASAALRNLIREEKWLEREKQREAQRSKRKKKRSTKS